MIDRSTSRSVQNRNMLCVNEVSSTCDIQAIKPRKMKIKWSFAKFEGIIVLPLSVKWTGYFDGKATRCKTMWVYMEHACSRKLLHYLAMQTAPMR